MKTTITTEDSKLVKSVETEVLRLLKTPLKDVVHEAVTHAVEKVTLHPTHPAAPQPAPAEAKLPATHKPGGKIAAVWAELDQLSAGGTVPTLAQIQAVAKKRKWNANNTRIEYYQWRKAHGIRGRVVVRAEPAVDRRAVQHDRRAAA